MATKRVSYRACRRPYQFSLSGLVSRGFYIHRSRNLSFFQLCLGMLPHSLIIAKYADETESVHFGKRTWLADAIPLWYKWIFRHNIDMSFICLSIPLSFSEFQGTNYPFFHTPCLTWIPCAYQSYHPGIQLSILATCRELSNHLRTRWHWGGWDVSVYTFCGLKIHHFLFDLHQTSRGLDLEKINTVRLSIRIDGVPFDHPVETIWYTGTCRVLRFIQQIVWASNVWLSYLFCQTTDWWIFTLLFST